MPPHMDSDSSDEGEEYTETNVLLGYAAEEPSGDTVSHLGGRPAWIDEKTAPSGTLAKCKICNGLLTLLLELNGDLPERFPGHERRLYIWSCRRKACRRKDGSVRGVRGIRIAKGAASKSKPKVVSKLDEEEVELQDKSIPQLGQSLFGVKDSANIQAPANPFANPFSTGNANSAPTNPFSKPSSGVNPFTTATISDPATASGNKDEVDTSLPQSFAEKVRLSSPSPATQPARPHEPWPAESAFAPPYPHYYLDAEYEALDAPSTPSIPENARVEIDNGGGEKGGKEDKEVFESSLDKTFQKFADRVGQNPEQVLRYEYNGKPLLYSDADAIGKSLAPHSENGSSSNSKIVVSRSGSGLTPCQNCGAERVFEVQLTPHAITELEADDMNIDGMEWGTIILRVCSKDCKPNDVGEGEVGYVEEWVGVQWEEVASKR
ncbi:hypothetical protein DM02DRAFT_551934 [Periconia macrospinosa]|uniref:Programmed cell death protein 2 C-terminal domain-containing protein n=1 Tax=Periconia macrospinosa TaxID=97972 RepID=A0A2V1E905_9PLEO|nr:hypothetical protein DM02DRAFT_551934 [Periconia macrospinosa]